ncbi:helix-turn-helix transcriptional regulator [Ruminococcus sp. NK3A76]|uniref:helix-turn-helix transcriptional regulator n=1 Tax=Ruminococcus sp. NK3A76 TaxID=877411 RepID=UPI0012EBB839|nr:helix-turn-helix transcriptional regulator [Ruminococcus sp. NK3A76]
MLYKHSFSPNDLPCPIGKDAPTKNKLRYYRTLKGLTQKQAATLIGIDRSTYIRWENGETKLYHQSKLAKTAEVFGCETSELSDE